MHSVDILLYPLDYCTYHPYVYILAENPRLRTLAFFLVELDCLLFIFCVFIITRHFSYAPNILFVVSINMLYMYVISHQEEKKKEYIKNIISQLFTERFKAIGGRMRKQYHKSISRRQAGFEKFRLA